jgi:hypothetical protein
MQIAGTVAEWLVRGFQYAPSRCRPAHRMLQERPAQRTAGSARIDRYLVDMQVLVYHAGHQVPGRLVCLASYHP